VTHAPSAVGHVIKELRSRGVANGLEGLLQGHLDVYSTVDVRVQQIVNDALEQGLAAYETRHPRAVGVTQGSVVVLGNGDARMLAESGGRARYNGRSAAYSDFNRAIESARQPGSAMKPIVYLGADMTGLARRPASAENTDPGLLLIQEGLRGVVRIPGGTAHALDSETFAIPVMGKTGTTSEFRDALFVGSTYGVGGITVAVRI